MLGLRQQVRGDELGAARRRPRSPALRTGRRAGRGRAVGIAATSCLAAVTQALPGPKILSTLRHGLRAVGERGDGLRAAHLEHACRCRRAPRRRARPRCSLAVAAGRRADDARGQPAMRAGTASMIAVEGSGATGGHIQPDRVDRRGCVRRRTPGMVSTRQRRAEAALRGSARRWRSRVRAPRSASASARLARLRIPRRSRAGRRARRRRSVA